MEIKKINQSLEFFIFICYSVVNIIIVDLKSKLCTFGVLDGYFYLFPGGGGGYFIRI